MTKVEQMVAALARSTAAKWDLPLAEKKAECLAGSWVVTTVEMMAWNWAESKVVHLADC